MLLWSLLFLFKTAEIRSLVYNSETNNWQITACSHKPVAVQRRLMFFLCVPLIFLFYLAFYSLVVQGMCVILLLTNSRKVTIFKVYSHFSFIIYLYNMKYDMQVSYYLLPVENVNTQGNLNAAEWRKGGLMLKIKAF